VSSQQSGKLTFQSLRPRWMMLKMVPVAPNMMVTRPAVSMSPALTIGVGAARRAARCRVLTPGRSWGARAQLTKGQDGLMSAPITATAANVPPRGRA
jgi:hypothetical protein